MAWSKNVFYKAQYLNIPNNEITQNSKSEPKKFSVLCTFKEQGGFLWPWTCVDHLWDRLDPVGLGHDLQFVLLRLCRGANLRRKFPLSPDQSRLFEWVIEGRYFVSNLISFPVSLVSLFWNFGHNGNSLAIYMLQPKSTVRLLRSSYETIGNRHILRTFLIYIMYNTGIHVKLPTKQL